jgi:aspartate/methionine/tyrosine aminotransferase
VSDSEFAETLAKRGVLCVPGTPFGMPGYVRFSYAVHSLEGIKKACIIVKEVAIGFNERFKE